MHCNAFSFIVKQLGNMEVMEHDLPHFPMNLSILLYLMGLMKLQTMEDSPEESHHRGGFILQSLIKAPQEFRFPQGNLHEAVFSPSTVVCR